MSHPHYVPVMQHPYLNISAGHFCNIAYGNNSKLFRRYYIAISFTVFFFGGGGLFNLYKTQRKENWKFPTSSEKVGNANSVGSVINS